jgi:hypothetical protein
MTPPTTSISRGGLRQSCSAPSARRRDRQCVFDPDMAGLFAHGRSAGTEADMPTAGAGRRLWASRWRRRVDMFDKLPCQPGRFVLLRPRGALATSTQIITRA